MHSKPVYAEEPERQFRDRIRRYLTGVKHTEINQNEPSHEIMVLFDLRNLILQMHMRSHPVGLHVWFLVGPFVFFRTSCVRTAKALARLCGCAGSPEPSLVAYVISTIISWAGSNGKYFAEDFQNTDHLRKKWKHLECHNQSSIPCSGTERKNRKCETIVLKTHK